jgi:hypothetical protein
VIREESTVRENLNPPPRVVMTKERAITKPYYQVVRLEGSRDEEYQ